MKKILVHWIKAILLIAMLSFAFHPGSQKPVRAAEQSSQKLPEGHDFATLVLGDAWDMSEFSDISQALNNSGQWSLLNDIQVQDGLFTAQSTDLKDAQFFALWPGYNTAMLLGKVGHNYPIDANTYHCLYLGMKVDSTAPVNQTPDVFQIFWFADERLNGAGGVWGFSKALQLYPEAGAGTPVHAWKLYKVDLSAAGTAWGGTPWSGRGSWQGLRIDPTVQANVDFAIDWVRLTDCKPVKLDLSLSGAQNASVWVKPDGTNREILVADKVSGNSYALDTQGIQPGAYTYQVKQKDQVISSGSFEINQTPVVEFAQPSASNGPDYATSAGNAWDFKDSSDVKSVKCAADQIHDDLLTLDTVSYEKQPKGCKGGGVADPQVYLNPPVPANTSQYRYLSFRMNADGPYQQVPGGMVARWIWSIQGASGRPGYRCHIVSQDIPFDVGWNTYTIDLFDAFQGSGEEWVGDCPSGKMTWQNSSPVLEMRFDPNENVTIDVLHQDLDWIRLTEEEHVKQGQPFTVQIGFNKPPDQIRKKTFYYTDNLQDPTQHLAQDYSSQSSSSSGAKPSASYYTSKAFLPLLSQQTGGAQTPILLADGINFQWNTKTVAQGEYYICTVVEDDYNQATYCSQAPVRVEAP